MGTTETPLRNEARRKMARLQSAFYEGYWGGGFLRGMGNFFSEVRQLLREDQ